MDPPPRPAAGFLLFRKQRAYGGFVGDAGNRFADQSRAGELADLRAGFSFGTKRNRVRDDELVERGIRDTGDGISIANTMLNCGAASGNTLSLNAFMNGAKKLYIDMLELETAFAYERTVTDEFGLYDMAFGDGQQPSFRNRYKDNSRHKVSAKAQLQYVYILGDKT